MIATGSSFVDTGTSSRADDENTIDTYRFFLLLSQINGGEMVYWIVNDGPDELNDE